MTQKEKNIFRLSRAITNSLRGVASEKERGTLEQWLAASKKNREIYEGFKQGSYLEQKLSDYNAVNRLGDYERFITTRRKRTRFSIKTFVRYAAILILPLGLALVLLLREKQPNTSVIIVTFSARTPIKAKIGGNHTRKPQGDTDHGRRRAHRIIRQHVHPVAGTERNDCQDTK